MAKPRKEPLCTFVVNKPFAMLTPQRLAILILLSKGWFAGSNFVYKPCPRHHDGWTYHLADYRERIRVRNKFGVDTIRLWRTAKVIRTEQTHECSTKAGATLTERGRQLLSDVAPEMLTAARAFARATLLTEIRRRRRERRFSGVVVRMRA